MNRTIGRVIAVFAATLLVSSCQGAGGSLVAMLLTLLAGAVLAACGSRGGTKDDAATGGASGTGGVAATGGNPGTGGTVDAGGMAATGGMTGTAGDAGTGGTGHWEACCSAGRPSTCYCSLAGTSSCNYGLFTTLPDGTCCPGSGPCGGDAGFSVDAAVDGSLSRDAASDAVTDASTDSAMDAGLVDVAADLPPAADAAGDATAGDATADVGLWARCCVNGLTSSCHCPVAVCNFGLGEVHCPDGTCFSNIQAPGQMCRGDAGGTGLDR